MPHKKRAVSFIIAGGFTSMTGTAYAAAAVASGGGETSLAVIGTLILSGLSQLGATGVLIKIYAAKTTKNEEDLKAIPLLVSALEAHKKSMEEHAAAEKIAMETHSKNIEELYVSRNDLVTDVALINQLHNILGCPKRAQKGD